MIFIAQMQFLSESCVFIYRYESCRICRNVFFFSGMLRCVILSCHLCWSAWIIMWIYLSSADESYLFSQFNARSMCGSFIGGMRLNDQSWLLRETRRTHRSWTDWSWLQERSADLDTRRWTQQSYQEYGNSLIYSMCHLNVGLIG